MKRILPLPLRVILVVALLIIVLSQPSFGDICEIPADFQFTQFLQLGDSGTEVKYLQIVLNALGYGAGQEDGIFGPNTEAAVKKYQADKGLVADGLVGSNTRRELNADLDELRKPLPPTLISPPDHSTVDTTTPTFRWNEVSNADYYALFISIYPYGEPNLVFDSKKENIDITGNSYRLSSGILINGGKYRWNMSSYNSPCWSDGYSEAWYFTVGGSPDLVVQNPTVTSSGPYYPGSSLSVSCTIKNQGQGSAGSSKVKYYLSTSPTGTDHYLGYDDVGSLSAGGTSSESGTFTIPDIPCDRDYYVVFYADADDQVEESNENNNKNYAGPIYVECPKPDLIVQNPSVTSSGPYYPGSSLSVSCTIKNQGQGSAGSSKVKYYLSTSPTGTDHYLGYDDVGSLSAGGTSSESGTFTIPDIPCDRDYYVVFYADADDQVEESNENNNKNYAGPIYVECPKPDLIVQNPSVTSSGPYYPGSSLSVSCTIKNQGQGSAGSSKVKYYLSTSPTGTEHNLGGDDVGSLSAGGTSSESETGTIPPGIPCDRDYYVVFYADADGQVAESDENNNKSNAGTIYVVEPRPPTVTITDPSDDPHSTDSTPITISGTCSDEDGDLSSVKVENSANGHQETQNVSGSSDTFSFSVPLNNGSNQITVTVYDSGNRTGTDTITVIYGIQPVMCIEPDPTTGLDFGDTETQMSFQIYNCGSGTLTWNLSENESWITLVEPTSGSSTGSNDKTTVTVTVSRNGLSAGYYTGVITVAPSHGNDQDVTIKMCRPLPVYPQPESQTVFKDSNGTVEIRIGEAITFGGFEFNMKFKHGIIDILTVEHGIPDQQGRNVIENGPKETIDGEYTTLFYGAASYGDPPPPSGALLATITFKGVGIGTTALELFDVKVGNADAKPFPVAVTDGEVTVDGDGESISGTITDGVNPIPATVQAWNNGTLVKEVNTPDGDYVLHLPAGTYAIRAYSAGYYAAVLDEITPPATNIDLPLTPAPTVTSTNKVCDFWCQDNTKMDWQTHHIPVLVQLGDVITARDPDDIICGITTVGDFSTDEGDYFLHIYGDDATTPDDDEGAEEGDIITFFINGYPASVISGPTPQWHSGGSFEVCLEAGDICVDINLCAGWNFFSFNVEPPNKDIETVLASIDGLYTYVRGMECGGKALTYDPSRPFNDLEQLEPLHGYEIKMSSDAILPVTGMPVSVTTPIALCAGWNFISYLPDVPCPTEEALASIDGLYTYVRGMECGGKALTYDPSRPFNDLEQLEALHGYEIKMSSDSTLVYPTSSSLLAFMRTSVPENQEPSSNQVLISNLAPALSSEAISGTVTDGVDPIQNATVQAWQKNQKIQETTTAPDGSYTLSGLAAGTYIVRAHKEGFYATYLDNQPAPSNGVNIVLESLPSIISTHLVCDFWSMDGATYSGEQPLLQIGDVVTAIDPDGEICGVTTVGEFGTDEGDFLLHVYGDEPGTEDVDEGAAEGDTITLMLNKYYPIKDVNPQPVWHASSSIQLTLVQFDRALPVGLSTVTATWKGDQIILSWQTQSETNNLGWDVYRSLRKDGTYRKINAAMIAGAGTSAEPHTYRFVDEHVEAGNAYFYYLENIDFDGKRHKSHIIQVEMLTTLGQIKYSALYPNFPNPFNPETWIPFKLASDSPVVIDIYDIKGKLVKRLDLGHKEAGYYLDRRSAAHWDGRSQTGERVASGIYLYTIKAGKFMATRRMVVVK